ncbi:nucleoside-diphosphate kinase, partial [Candidatus Woesearchaeota archaeon]|nr:nucleoside-diphosphate kinase [Candidatus Woesearchaeota archaeon]
MTEQTLIIIKPDALNRTVVGEIIHRFERKGLKIVGMKMTHLTEDVLEEHYSHLKDKPFYPILMKFMQAAPSLLMILEGNNVVEVVRKMAGPTHGAEA